MCQVLLCVSLCETEVILCISPKTESRKKITQVQQLAGGVLGGSGVKNPPASVGDGGLIPGLGRSPSEGKATHSSVLAWEIP